MPPRRIRDPQRREKILTVAESLFAVGGYDGVGMRPLASAAGLGKSSLFHHFPTKLDLYAAVVDRIFERVEVGLGPSAGAGEAGEPGERVDRWIDALVGALAEDLQAARLMLRCFVDPRPRDALPFAEDRSEREWRPFEVRLRRIVEPFRQAFEEGIERGIFRPVAVEDAVRSVLGLVLLHFSTGADLPIEEAGLRDCAREDRRRHEVREFIRCGLRA